MVATQVAGSISLGLQSSEMIGDDEDVAFGIVGFDVGELVTVVDREARRCRALPNQEAVPVQPFLL